VSGHHHHPEVRPVVLMALVLILIPEKVPDGSSCNKSATRIDLRGRYNLLGQAGPSGTARRRWYGLNPIWEIKSRGRPL